MIPATIKSIPLSLLFCLILVLCASIAKAQVAAQGMIFLPTDKNLLFVGRWDRRDPTVYHSHWTGAYIRTRFTGTSVGITLAGGLGLAVSIDGEVPRPFDGK